MAFLLGVRTVFSSTRRSAMFSTATLRNADTVWGAITLAGFLLEKNFSKFTFIARRVVKRNGQNPLKYILNPTSTSVRNDKLITAMKHAMVNPACATQVVCFPQHTGKTYAIVQAANELLKAKAISGVVHITDCEGAKTAKSMNDWLRKMLRVSPDAGTSDLSSILPDEEDEHGNVKPFLVVLDQFDAAATNSNLEAFIVQLSTEAARTRKLVIFIAISDSTLRDSILNMNGLRKIQPLFDEDHPFPTWTADMLEVLYNEQATAHAPHLVDDKHKKDFLKIAAETGSPGFVARVVSEHCNTERFPNLNIDHCKNVANKLTQCSN